MFNLNNKLISRLIMVEIHKVFSNLNKISLYSGRLILYKQNLYDFFFLGETNRYVTIRGVMLKSKRINGTNIILGKRINFFSKIANEYIYFKLCLNIPSLHF